MSGIRKKTLIIGGVAGGATAAARLRRNDETMEIIVFERGDYISYANCGLPYYIGDVIKSRDALLLQTPEAMKKKFHVDVRCACEVIQILTEEQSIEVKNKKTGETYLERYDNLIIATGSSPIVPPIDGIHAKNIFTLWTIPDTDSIKAYIKEKQPKTAAVIGGGFIGLEMAENLAHAGLDVSLIEMQEQVMAPLDFEMAQLLHENMRMNGVDLILGDGVNSFSQKNHSTEILLNSQKTLTVDMIILAIGIRPNSQLAKEANLALNSRGGIIVNEYLETSVKNIYAVGDVIEVTDYALNDKKGMIPLAGPANKQGRIVADNLTGERKAYKGSLGTAVAKVFDLNAACVGVNEKRLISLGKVKNKDYYTVLINQKSHAGYYPGATPITLKLIFDKEGNIFGAQIVGQDGVDKRIDTIAATMHLHGTIYDLAELELAYAPPFSSAKDPVNMLGFTAENLLKEKVSFIEWKELDQLIAGKDTSLPFAILDVTEEMERMVYSIPLSIHIPLGSLRERINELDKNELIIPYCAIGVRSYNAARILMQNGFNDVKVLSGGTSFYKSMHHSICRKPAADLQSNQSTVQESNEIKRLDCCGLQCPGPIMKVNETLNQMKIGETLKVSATDMGFARDMEAWCKRTDNTFIKRERKGSENIVYVKKGREEGVLNAAQIGSNLSLPQGKTLIVFSGDLDKVLASFIIANGAAAMGRPVTMFFTFWGLNALRKSKKMHIKKPFMDKMFGAMMPRGSQKLKLSKMNMAGMGTKMMKKVMNDKNVDSLESLMKYAMKNGIKLVACTMSMDIMGITKEELIDGVELAGVASYLGDAEESNVNLFI